MENSEKSPFLGSYNTACGRPTTFLFRSGNADAVTSACTQAPVGKLLPNALYIHRSALIRSGRCCGFTRGCAGVPG